VHVYAVLQVALKASQKQLAALMGGKPPAAAQASLAATATQPAMLKAQSTQTEPSKASETTSAAAAGVQGGSHGSNRAPSPAGSTTSTRSGDAPGDAPGDASLRKKLHQLQGALQQATADYGLLLKELGAIRTEVAHHQAAASAASATEQQLRQQLADLRQQLQLQAAPDAAASVGPTAAMPMPTNASHKQQQQQVPLEEDVRGPALDDRRSERDCMSPASGFAAAVDPQHWYDPLGSTMGKQALMEAGLGSRPLSPYTTHGGDILQRRGTAAAGALGLRSGSASPGSEELPMGKSSAGRASMAGDVARRPAGLSSSRLAAVRHGGRQRSPERCLPPTGYR
jgi:hypothetical protein